MRWILALSLLPFFGNGVAQEREKYFEALQKRPDSETIYRRFEATFLENGSVDELREFLTSKSETAGDFYVRGVFENRRRNFSAALAAFERAVELDEDFGKAWLAKARAEAKLGKSEAALTSLDKADDADGEGSHLRARLLMESGDRAGALAVWQGLLKKNPGDDFLVEQILAEQRKAGLRTEALELMRRWVEGSADVYDRAVRQLELVDLLAEMDRSEEAVARCRAVLEMTGSDSWLERETLGRLESVFRKGDDIVGLERELANLAKTFPNRVGLATRRADVLIELAKGNEAEEIYRDLLERTPGDRGLREGFVGMLGRIGKKKAAMEEMARLCELNSEDASLWLELAELQRAVGEGKAAMDSVKNYLDNSPGDEGDFARVILFLERAKVPNGGVISEFFAAWKSAWPESVWRMEMEAESLFRREKKPAAVALWKALAGGDLAQLLRVVGVMTSVGEHELAWETLRGRVSDFGSDSSFLGRAVAGAIAAGQEAEAFDLALRRVKLARDGANFEAAADQALSLIGKENEAVFLEKLEAEESVGARCLLALAYEKKALRNRVTEVLDGLPDDDDFEKLVAATRLRIFVKRRNWARAAEVAESQYDVRKAAIFRARNGEVEASRKWIGEWRLATPTSVESWQFEAALLEKNGQAAERLRVLKQVADRFPDRVDLRMELVDAVSEAGDVATAENLLWDAWEEAESTSDKAVFGKRLAELSDRHNREAEMVLAFEERSRKNPQSIVPLLGLLEVHRETRNVDGQRAVLNRAIRLKPKDVGLWHELARVEQVAKRPAGAMAALEEAAKVDGSGRSEEAIARLLLQTGRAEEGYRRLFAAFGEEENFSEIEVELIAATMLGRGDLESAAALMARQLPRFPEDYRLNFLAGTIAENRGDTTAAIELFLTTMVSRNELPRMSGTPSGIGSRSDFGIYGTLWQTESDAYDKIALPFHTSVGYAGNVAARASNLNLPTSVEEAHGFALHHLLRVTRGREHEWEGHIVERLAAAGVEDAAVVMRIPSNDRDRVKIPASLMDEHPENAGLHWYWAEQLGYWDSVRVPVELLRRSFAVLKEVDPRVATKMGLFLLAAEKEDATAEFAAEVAALGRKIQKVGLDEMHWLGVAHAVRYDGGIQDEWAGGRRFDDVTALVELWFDRAVKNGQLDSAIFYVAAGSLRHAGDGDGYVRLLQRASEISNSAPSAFLSQHRHIGPRRVETLAIPLEFPPRHLPGVTPAVRLYCGGVEPNGSYFTKIPELDHDAVKAGLGKATDPVLRALLAYQVGENDAALAAIGEIDGPNRDWLTAAFAWQNGECAESFATLEKLASSSAIDGQWLREIRRVQLHQAREMAGSQDAVPNEILEKILRDLAVARLTPYQRGELAETAYFLGKPDLQKQIEASGTVAWYSDEPLRPIRYINWQRLEEGNVDVEKELASQTIDYVSAVETQIAVSEFSNFQYLWKKVVENKIDWAPVLEKFAAQPSRSGQLATALIHLHTGKSDRALDIFDALLESWPADRKVRHMAIFLALRVGNLERARHFFEPDLHKTEAMQALVKVERRCYYADNKMLSLAKFALQEIERNPEFVGGWLDEIRKEIQPGGNSEKLHADLCAAMINAPTLARDGFMRLNGENVIASPEKLDQAREVLRRFRADPNRKERYLKGTLPPEFILASHALRTGTEAELRDGFLAELSSKPETAESARLLEIALKLNFCPPNQLQKTATDFQQAEQNRLGKRDEEMGFAELVIFVWSERIAASQKKNFPDLTGFMMGTVRRHYQRQLDLPRFSKNYAVELDRLNRHQSARKFIDELALFFLGPVEGRRARVQQHYQPASNSRGRNYDGKIKSFLDANRYFRDSRTIVLPWIELWISVGFSESSEMRLDAWHTLNVESRLAALKHSPVLADLPDFRAGTHQRNEIETNSIVKTILRPLRSAGKEKIPEFLSSIKQPTFGSELLLKLLETSDHVAAVEQIVTAHQEKFWKPEAAEARREIFFLTKEFIRTSGEPAKTDPPFFAKLRQEFETEADKISEIDRILTLREPDRQIWEFSQYCSPVIAKAFKKNPDKGIKAMAHVRRLIEDGLQQNSAFDRRNGLSNFAQNIADSLDRHHFRFLIELQRIPQAKKFGFWVTTSNNSLADGWLLHPIDPKTKNTLTNVDPKTILPEIEKVLHGIDRETALAEPNTLGIVDTFFLTFWKNALPETRPILIEKTDAYAAAPDFSEPWWWASWKNARQLTDPEIDHSTQISGLTKMVQREGLNTHVKLALASEAFLARNETTPPIEIFREIVQSWKTLLENQKSIGNQSRNRIISAVIELDKNHPARAELATAALDAVLEMHKLEGWQIWNALHGPPAIGVTRLVYETGNESAKKTLLDDHWKFHCPGQPDGFVLLLELDPDRLKQLFQENNFGLYQRPGNQIHSAETIKKIDKFVETLDPGAPRISALAVMRSMTVPESEHDNFQQSILDRIGTEIGNLKLGISFDEICTDTENAYDFELFFDLFTYFAPPELWDEYSACWKSIDEKIRDAFGKNVSIAELDQATVLFLFLDELIVWRDEGNLEPVEKKFADIVQRFKMREHAPEAIVHVSDHLALRIGEATQKKTTENHEASFKKLAAKKNSLLASGEGMKQLLRDFESQEKP